MMTRSRALVISVLCQTAPADAVAQLSDSAGVTIVTISRAATGRRAPISLADSPTLVLRASPSRVEYEFADVPAVARLSDSTVVVVNRATNELRFFSPRGAFIRSAGRKGKGPGEFTSIAAFAVLLGDSLMVQDWSTSRVAVFDRNGGLARSFTLGPPPQRPRAALVGSFADGTLLGAGSDYLTDADPPPGLFTLTQTLYAFSATGTPLRPLNSLVERQFLFVAGPRGSARYVQPFGLLGTVCVSGDTYLTADGGRFEIREYRRTGELFRIIRADLAPRRLTQRDKDAEKQRILAFYGQKTTTPGFERFWSAVHWPPGLPAFRRFEVGSNGHLWVELYVTAGETPRWLVFDPDRRLLGYVAGPERFDIRQVLAGGVIGVRRDADDVEQVVFYPFARR